MRIKKNGIARLPFLLMSHSDVTDQSQGSDVKKDEKTVHVGVISHA